MVTATRGRKAPATPNLRTLAKSFERSQQAENKSLRTTEDGIYVTVKRRAERAGIGKAFTHPFRQTFAHKWLAQAGRDGD